MKKILQHLFFSSFSLFICISSHAQWSEKLSLSGLQSIDFASAPNDKIIWALTNNRNIYLSQNGGNTWTHYAANGITGDVRIEWIFAFDASTALLACTTNFTGKGPGIIYRTTNGGHNWTQVLSHDGNCDFKIGMSDKNKGLLVIDFDFLSANTQNELLATLDGGATWTNQFITNPTNYYYINDFFVKGREAWLQAHDSMYYSSNLGISWTAEKVATNIGFNHMQFENKNYGIGNNGALIDIFIKRPPKKAWQDIGDPTGVSGAVSAIALNGNECWLSEALDAIDNFYSSDSCKTFTPIRVDPQSAFLILQRTWKGNNTIGATRNKLYVYVPSSENITLKPKENMHYNGFIKTATE